MSSLGTNNIKPDVGFGVVGKKTVTSGIAEFLITCRNKIFLSLNPLALSTVTKGLLPFLESTTLHTGLTVKELSQLLDTVLLLYQVVVTIL